MGAETQQTKQEALLQTTEVVNNGEKQTPQKTLQQTINEAKEDGKINQEELSGIIDRYNEEEKELTDKTKSELKKLHKEIGEGFLKNGVTINKGNLDFINKLLVSLNKKPINLENIQKEMEDLKNFVIKSSSKGDDYLTLYKSEKGGDRIGYLDLAKGEFEVDRNWIGGDTNKGTNNEFKVDPKKEVNVEKKQIPKVEEPRPIEPRVEASKTENISINEDSLKTKGITSYTKKHYKEYFEDINKINFSKIPNKDELKKLLSEPSEKNIKQIQELIGIKGKRVDGKFGPKTMEALKKYIEEKNISTGALKTTNTKGDKPADLKVEEGKVNTKAEDKKEVKVNLKEEKIPTQKTEEKIVAETPKGDKKPPEAAKS